MPTPVITTMALWELMHLAWVYDVQLHIAGTIEPKSSQQAKQGT